MESHDVPSVRRGEIGGFNKADSTTVSMVVSGHVFHLTQDPSSNDCATTIWDASIILVRYMEINPQLYSRARLTGKTVLELGAGCSGLAGLYFAAQGATVTFTDLPNVVPLLKRNVAVNLHGLEGDTDGGRSGLAPKVVAHIWGEPIEDTELAPPYDYVVACDCVYMEEHVPPLVKSIARLSSRHTTVVIASEKRDLGTYERFRARLSDVFKVRQVARRRVDKRFDHDNSEILLCRRKPGAAAAAAAVAAGLGSPVSPGPGPDSAPEAAALAGTGTVAPESTLSKEYESPHSSSTTAGGTAVMPVVVGTGTALVESPGPVVEGPPPL